MLNIRRAFLKSLAAGAAGSALLAEPYRTLAQGPRKKVKITDVKCMIIRGTWDWNLIKIETDAGISASGRPTGPLASRTWSSTSSNRSSSAKARSTSTSSTPRCFSTAGGAGAIGGVTIIAASGIEIALWDLAGRILQTPVCNLLGGRFRDRVRFYRTLQAPSRPTETSSWRDQAAEVQANNKYGFTAWKFQGDSIPVNDDPTCSQPGHDFYAFRLTNHDIRDIVEKMDAVRHELGPDKDLAIECHWKYQLNDAIKCLNALEHTNPMWLEDPLPENNDAMARLARATNTPIATGENLYGFQAFRTLIEMQAVAGVHIDIPKSGGLMESKRISDFASPIRHPDRGAQPRESHRHHRFRARCRRHAQLPHTRTREVDRLVADSGRT